jgi:hypothetical protein
LGGYNFLNSIPFFTIFNALGVPIKGVQILFEHPKSGAFPWIWFALGT